MSDRPNVLLVVLDTARADALEPYGAAPGSSPAIADLARRGAAVAHAYAPANWTLPSHVSFLSGLLPRSTGLRLAMGDPQDQSRNAELVAGLAGRMLPAVLRAAGWDTRAVSANPWVDPFHGFGGGFEEFVAVTGSRGHDRSFGTEHGAEDQGRRARLRRAVDRSREALRAEVDDGAEQAGRVVREWVAGLDRRRPFFWFVNLLECHSPYAPPRGYARLGPLERVRAAADDDRYGTLDAVVRTNCGLLSLPDPVLDRMRRAYPGGVRNVDRWLADVLAALDAARVLDDTLVVVTSDHGENLGESGRTGHMYWLDERLLHVPLVCAGPVELTTTGAFSLSSLPRLVADAVGLREHPWHADALPTGLAVAQADAAIDPNDPRLPAAIEERNLDEFAVWRLTTPGTMATDGRYKVVREGDDDWLYDLDADRDEVAPVRLDARVALGYGPEVARLRDAVDAAAPRSGGPLIAAQRAPASAQSAPPAAPDPQLAERMRMLGYL